MLEVFMQKINRTRDQNEGKIQTLALKYATNAKSCEQSPSIIRVYYYSILLCYYKFIIINKCACEYLSVVCR